MKDRIILDLCGGTGAWSRPYLEAGYDVRLITLPEHDVRTYISPGNVYGILAAPPCTEFSFAKTTGKPRDLAKGIEIVQACQKIIWLSQIRTISKYANKTSLKFWAIENPSGLLKRFLGKPPYRFQPWEFGNNYKKETFLWGWFNNPHKKYTNIKNVLSEDEIKKNYFNSGSLPNFGKMKTKEIAPEYYGKLTRQERRSITPAGFAKAFFKSNK